MTEAAAPQSPAQQSTSPRNATTALSRTPVDLVVVGAGIVGLAHAWHAHQRGLRVTVIERDEHAVGASVRNFGHACLTAQSGIARDYAEVSRREWLRLREAAGISVQEVGTTVVVRNAQEAAVLEQFAIQNHGDAQLMDARETAAVLGVNPAHIHSGAHLPRDLRLDPRTAVAQFARYLASVGVTFHFGTQVGAIEPGVVHTSRGQLRTTHTVVAVNHDLDRLFPNIADRYELTRCRLRMLEVEAPRGVRIAPAILTGLSLLRYDAFRELPAFEALRAHTAETSPELLAHDLNHMLTQRPNGNLIIGDTHHRERTETPFEDERSDELVLAETARLFDVPHLTVKQRWRGVYASSPVANFVCETPLDRVRVATVATGIGMTTALGFAEASLTTLLDA